MVRSYSFGLHIHLPELAIMRFAPGRRRVRSSLRPVHPIPLSEPVGTQHTVRYARAEPSAPKIIWLPPRRTIPPRASSVMTEVIVSSRACRLPAFLPSPIGVAARGSPQPRGAG
jgi:hypothetical protein